MFRWARKKHNNNDNIILWTARERRTIRAYNILEAKRVGHCFHLSIDRFAIEDKPFRTNTTQTAAAAAAAGVQIRRVATVAVATARARWVAAKRGLGAWIPLGCVVVDVGDAARTAAAAAAFTRNSFRMNGHPGETRNFPFRPHNMNSRAYHGNNIASEPCAFSWFYWWFLDGRMPEAVWFIFFFSSLIKKKKKNKIDVINIVSYI